MSERPFMQLYVSDFIGDTLHLNTEQIGAYMLLLMAMWNAGGKLPADDGKLARVVRMSLKKWRSISSDLLPFFECEDGVVWHRRLTKELQKSESKTQSRAAAGAIGGAAKALKYNEATVANATVLPKHLPEARNHIVIEPIAQHTVSEPAPRKVDQLSERLLQAAGLSGFREERNVGLVSIAPILDLMAKGYDLDRDIIPAVEDIGRRGKRFNTWSYVVPFVVERSKQRAAIPAKAAEPEVDWKARLDVWQSDGTWAAAWGPPPNAKGCRAPPELIGRAA